MAMRPVALSVLLLVAAAGCGVPDPSSEVMQTTPPPKKEAHTEAPPTPVKAAEEDPTKLGEKITDAVVGTGVTAEPGDTCVMKYAGRLKSNNKEFDSNNKPDGKPFSFTLGAGSVIKGWDIGVKGMKVGGKRTLEIPAILGYGAEGGGEKIPPNSDLIFDIELVDVQKAGDSNTVVRETVTPGTGTPAKAGDVVTIKYKASTPDGTMVDDNGGKTIQFKIGAPEITIPGLNLALAGMRQGQTVRATIPPALGIQRPMPGSKVPPNSTMKFEITLVKIG